MTISKECLAEINAMPGNQIDISDIPELDETFFEKARLVLPAGMTKKTVNMRKDEKFFRNNSTHTAKAI